MDQHWERERERGLKDVFGTRPNPFVERSFYTHTFNIYWRWEKDLKFFSKKGKEKKKKKKKKMFSPYDFLWGHKMDRTPARERKSRVIREYCAACGIVESLPLQPKLFNPQGRRRRRRRSWNNIRCTLKTSRRTGPFLVYVIFSQIARWDGNRLLIEGVTSLGRRGRTRQFVASTMARCLRIGIATHVRCFAIRVDDEHKFSRFGRGGPSCVFSSFFALVGTKATDHYVHFVQLHHLRGMCEGEIRDYCCAYCIGHAGQHTNHLMRQFSSSSSTSKEKEKYVVIPPATSFRLCTMSKYIDEWIISTFFLNKMGNEIKNWNTSNLERNDLDFLLLHYCIRRFLLNNLSPFLFPSIFPRVPSLDGSSKARNLFHSLLSTQPNSWEMRVKSWVTRRRRVTSRNEWLLNYSTLCRSN